MNRFFVAAVALFAPLWPDGTKHWLNISAAQWDASGRDWGAIFIINDREAAFYAAGADIVR